MSEDTASFKFTTQNGMDFTLYECQFNNGGDFIPCQSGMTYEVGVDGIHTFRVRAKNSQGYYTSITSYSFTRDTSAPSITLLSPSPETRIKNSFIISASVSDGIAGSGTEVVSCSLDRVIGNEVQTQTISPCTFPMDLSNEMTGIYKLTISATDKVDLHTTSPKYIFYYINEETQPAFITLNLAGGAALAANVIPGNSNGDFLDSYNLLGLGSKDSVINNYERYIGARWAKNSGLKNGIKRHLSSGAEAHVRVFSIPVQSADDSSLNPFDVQTYIMASGLQGTYVRNTASSGVRNTGILQSTLFTGDTGLELPLNPIFVQGSGFFSTGTSSPSNFQTFDDFPLIQDYDPAKDPLFYSIFGLAQYQTIPRNQTTTINEVIFNAINGNTGPASINLTGYDYRGIPRADSDNRDLVAGEWIGRSLEYAFRTGKKLMIYVPTDGSASSPPFDECCQGWIANRGVAGQLLFFVVDPQTELAVGNYTTDYMIGNFISATQIANDEYWSTSDSRVNSREMAALSVVANYLELANKRSLISDLTQGIIRNSELDKFVKVKRK